MESNKKIPWTQEEDEILRQYYPEERGKAVQRLPGRTLGSCYARARVLGLSTIKNCVHTGRKNKKCIVCGADTGSISANYCKACRDKNIKDNAIRDRVCTICGVTFKGWTAAKYCPDCQKTMRNKYSREAKQRQAAGTARKIGSTDICVVCGKPYTVSSGIQKYCPACKQAAYDLADAQSSKEWRDKNGGNEMPRKYRQTMKNRRTETKICVVCGKEFETHKKHIITCSPECSKKSKTLNTKKNNKQ